MWWLLAGAWTARIRVALATSCGSAGARWVLPWRATAEIAAAWAARVAAWSWVLA
jgi:hypothetical protein